VRRVLRLLLGLAVLVANIVFAEPPNTRQGAVSGLISQPAGPEPINDQAAMGAAPSYKTLENGLYMSGAWSVSWSGSSASMTLAQISNDSFIRTTGTLRTELWAVNTLPGRAQAFTGYRLAVFGNLAPLAPRRVYTGVTGSATMLYPPDGTYWLLLVLTEFDSACAQADRFCQQDSVPSDSRETFGAPPASNFGNFSDLWWNSNESGWGVTITHHSSGIAFITWFTYDDFGNPKWYVASNCRIVSNFCSDTLYETTGPPFAATFNPAVISVRSVGSISLSFTGLNTGRMSYAVRGSSGFKTISRQPF
jgi:hypothetical protein